MKKFWMNIKKFYSSHSTRCCDNDCDLKSIAINYLENCFFSLLDFMQPVSWEKLYNNVVVWAEEERVHKLEYVNFTGTEKVYCRDTLRVRVRKLRFLKWRNLNFFRKRLNNKNCWSGWLLSWGSFKVYFCSLGFLRI